MVLVGPEFLPVLGAPIKACSKIDNGGEMAGVFEILGTNLSVAAPNDA